MRRSAAPSQLSRPSHSGNFGGVEGPSAKRPKFVAPGPRSTRTDLFSVSASTSSSITGTVENNQNVFTSTNLTSQTRSNWFDSGGSERSTIRAATSRNCSLFENVLCPETKIENKSTSVVNPGRDNSNISNCLPNKINKVSNIASELGSENISSVASSNLTGLSSSFLATETLERQDNTDLKSRSLLPPNNDEKTSSQELFEDEVNKDSTVDKFRKHDLMSEISPHPLKSQSENRVNPLQYSTSVREVPTDIVPMRYFSVVWCKLSKKKHKKWEGDAVLTTKGRSATLYDIEGKMIGKGTGYKKAELDNLKDDGTLAIGGKEIQVMSVLTEENYKSGKCFSAAGSSSEDLSNASNISLKNKSASKPFANPLLKPKSSAGQMVDENNEKAVPKYDPTAPGALVMPRPRPDHQWKNNKQGSTIVDVVVDPYLSTRLRSHQQEGVIFLYQCVMGFRDMQGLGAILADDMGLGKTLQCIALIWTLLKQGPYGGKPVAKKILIITPGSLVKNWFLEFKKWLGTERLSVYAVSAEKRAEDFVKSSLHPVLIISYEMFVRCCDLVKEVNFDLIICDEGHRLKNTAIKTTSLIMSLPSRRRIVLTGTPVQNDLQEFYSIVEFCNPGILGSSAAFRRVYEDPIVASRQPKATAEEKELGADRAQELTRLTQMFVLRRTQEINNSYLPPKVELVLFCHPSPLQLALYRQLIRSKLIRRCLNGHLANSAHLICIGALKELCNHPGLIYRKTAEREREKMAQAGVQGEAVQDSIYDNLFSLFPESFDASTVSVEDSGKLVVLANILSSIWSHSDSEKVVLISNHTRTLDFLQVFCDLQGYTYLRLDGQTATSQRQELVNRFNNKYSPQRIFLLSSKAGGVGLNLVGASRLILYDIDWNPANDLQAMARVWRDGQKGKVHIYRLLTTGTIEEKIYQRQISKQGLSGAVMDLGNKNNVHFSLEDLRDLFSLSDRTDSETHTMLSCDCNGDPEYVPVPVPSDLEAVPDERPCQLGNFGKKATKGKESNLTMAELLRWKHWRGEFGQLNQDWRLDSCGRALSFIFWHETNPRLKD